MKRLFLGLLSLSMLGINATGFDDELTDEKPRIEEAFVTFATGNYFSLLEVLLDSIHYFSKRPVVAYGINADIPFSLQNYPRLIKKRIDVDLKKVKIFHMKPRIILESNVQFGVYVEADDIVNDGVDILFQECRSIQEYPLCPRHPDDPNNQKPIMQALGVKEKTMPYVHGHVLFADFCRPLITNGS